jgi:hypothetical protein
MEPFGTAGTRISQPKPQQEASFIKSHTKNNGSNYDDRTSGGTTTRKIRRRLTTLSLFFVFLLPVFLQPVIDSFLYRTAQISFLTTESHNNCQSQSSLDAVVLAQFPTAITGYETNLVYPIWGVLQFRGKKITRKLKDQSMTIRPPILPISIGDLPSP